MHAACGRVNTRGLQNDEAATCDMRIPDDGYPDPRRRAWMGSHDWHRVRRHDAVVCADSAAEGACMKKPRGKPGAVRTAKTRRREVSASIRQSTVSSRRRCAFGHHAQGAAAASSRQLPRQRLGAQLGVATDLRPGVARQPAVYRGNRDRCPRIAPARPARS